MDWLQLTAAEGIGPRTIRALLHVYDNATEVIKAASPSGAKVLGEAIELPETTRRSLAAAIHASRPSDELERLRVIGGHLIAYNDSRYPPLLMQIPDPPALLRVGGDPAAITASAVAVVGTRQCSPDGLVQAGRFASGLAECGVTVCSGGARGIDAEAHRSCMRSKGRTVVVLGSGLSQPYPWEHRRLFDDVRACGGAIVSEYPMGRPPRPSQFPRRNRIISGLSQGVLVVEAPVRSGAMLTLKMAVEAHGRASWALPWPVGHRTGRGGNEAIRDGWSAMALDVSDVLGDLPELIRRTDLGTSANDASITSTFSQVQLQVVTSLRRGGRSVSQLVEGIHAAPVDVMRALTSLEMLGIIARRDKRVTLTPAGVAAMVPIARDQSQSTEAE